MEQLPNNCRLGKMSIFPKNWNAKRISKEDLARDWYIKYRFYDDNLHQEKQVVIKSGVNSFYTVAEKQDAIKDLIRIELNELRNGYNPITKRKIVETKEETAIVGPYTPFTKAVLMAMESLKLEGFTRHDMAVIIEKIVETSAKIYIDGEAIDGISIYDIKKRHIRALMNKLAADNNWSAHAWNKYRSYLMMIFKELGEYDAVESNIPREISKKKTVKKIRVVLSPDERIRVRKALEVKNRRFWLFINIFFHSGARVSEFFRLKMGNINLQRQTMLVTIKKGRQYVEVIKPIKDIALPFWKEYLSGCFNKDFFIMGEGLYPAEKPIRYEQINHRWQRIKKNLNIEADFYSLKHLNTDQVSEQIGIERAQKLNSHTSVRTTKIYAINENVREMELIKKVANEF